MNGKIGGLACRRLSNSWSSWMHSFSYLDGSLHDKKWTQRKKKKKEEKKISNSDVHLQFSMFQTTMTRCKNLCEAYMFPSRISFYRGAHFSWSDCLHHILWTGHYQKSWYKLSQLSMVSPHVLVRSNLLLHHHFPYPLPLWEPELLEERYPDVHRL